MPSQTHPLPVFLHGLWRCGSTYVWSRFRALENTYCYYEPLQHGLSRLTAARIGRTTPQANDADHHPDMDRPPFEEYRPLLKRRGVKTYARSFCDRAYYLHERQPQKKLRRYIESLITYGQSQARIPVLGFNRSCLRAGWLHHTFPAYNLHIDRDPLELWRSYQRLMSKGNRTFFSAWLLMIERNADIPVLAPLAARLPLRRGRQKLLHKAKAYYHNVLDDLTPNDTYFMIHYLWVVCSLHSLSYADAVLDMNRASEDGYAATLSRHVKQGCHLPVDFSGLRASVCAPQDILGTYKEIEADVKHVLTPRMTMPLYQTRPLHNHLQTLHPRKAETLNGYIR